MQYVNYMLMNQVFKEANIAFSRKEFNDCFPKITDGLTIHLIIESKKSRILGVLYLVAMIVQIWN